MDGYYASMYCEGHPEQLTDKDKEAIKQFLRESEEWFKKQRETEESDPF